MRKKGTSKSKRVVTRDGSGAQEYHVKTCLHQGGAPNRAGSAACHGRVQGQGSAAHLSKRASAYLSSSSGHKATPGEGHPWNVVSSRAACALGTPGRQSLTAVQAGRRVAPWQCPARGGCPRWPLQCLPRYTRCNHLVETFEELSTGPLKSLPRERSTSRIVSSMDVLANIQNIAIDLIDHFIITHLIKEKRENSCRRQRTDACKIQKLRDAASGTQRPRFTCEYP